MKFVPPEGVAVMSTHHCDKNCRQGNGEPTEGRYAFFDCEVAEYYLGGPLDDTSEGSAHTVIVNDNEEYNILVWTNALNWQASD